MVEGAGASSGEGDIPSQRGSFSLLVHLDLLLLPGGVITRSQFKTVGQGGQNSMKAGLTWC